MSEDVSPPVTYFRYCGEINTENLLRLAKKRCEELGIGKVIIASETGRSALKALKIFKESGIKMIVVTHYPGTTIGPKGEIPIGLMREEYAGVREKLLAEGVRIVQGTRPLVPPSRFNWNEATPEGILDKALEIFGAGTKIAIEVAIMATDASEVNPGEEVVSCGGTYKGLDTALVVKTCHSYSFFRDFEVREIIAKPRYRVIALPEYKFENWKGDVEQYYERLG
ncbi:MAG: hypothetical protein N3F63_05955 [Thermoplasmata archaeon]|nr:hypothetical protein [Thermoplasmata archaeon]